ncbi:MAG: tetratricopeptide repeat protein, partial [Desulfobacterales bacterium]|nr:tetratricopeptide repeat protein [Desulfobacterales bacterium]
MGINSEQDEFIINLRKITNFFRYTLESGLLFCVCTNQVFVKQINEQIKARTSGLGLNVRELYISPDDIDIFIPIIRQAANENPDGIIINNLDELILVSKGSFLEGINLAREILLDLDIPMLFWLSERNVSLFANKAHDLFRRRDRGVVYFSDLSGSSGMDRFKESYSREYMSSEDYNSLNLKIGLLEKQLGEAEAKQYKEKRIATEIVADLIKLYLKVFLRHEAYALFEKYGKYFEDDNIKYVDLKADLYYDICMWDKALEFYLKSEKISLEVGDKAGLSQTYNNIGLIYDNKGDWDRALEFYLKSEKIVIEVGDKAGLGPIYNNIGLIYRKKSDWDRALEFYLKS